MQFDSDTIERVAQAVYGEYHPSSETLIIWDGDTHLEVFDTKGGLVIEKKVNLPKQASRNPYSIRTIEMVKDRIGQVKNSLAHNTEY